MKKAIKISPSCATNYTTNLQIKLPPQSGATSFFLQNFLPTAKATFGLFLRLQLKFNG